jgi:hypothetical protein
MLIVALLTPITVGLNVISKVVEPPAATVLAGAIET